MIVLVRSYPLSIGGVGLIALMLAGSCAVNPVTGKREVIIMSPAQEAAIGREESVKVAATMGLIESAELVAYADAVGQRLAAGSPRKDVVYRFHVVDMAEANAFALPGGYIYVSRGLLALVNSEAELANVIGHEIGHVAARHAAQRQTRATGVGLPCSARSWPAPPAAPRPLRWHRKSVNWPVPD
jgi:predicted Zn-dependent protease